MSTIAMLTIEQAMTLMAFGGAEGTTCIKLAGVTGLGVNHSLRLVRELRRLGLAVHENGGEVVRWHLTTEGRSRRRMLFRMIQGVSRD